jgi:ATP-dependent Clp protease adaptor protein ClpS
MPTTIDRPLSPLGLPGLDDLTDIRDGLDIGGPWVVILYNCECHTFDDVIEVLCIATGCTVDQAAALALKVHTEGRAIVFDGERDECERVTEIIASVRLQVEMDRA